MSASLNTPGARHAQAIRDGLEDMRRALAKLGTARGLINDIPLGARVDACIAAVTDMLAAHHPQPGPSLPEQAGTLRLTISEMAIPSRDTELGPTESLEQLQAAEGVLVVRLDRLIALLPAPTTGGERRPRAETGAAEERIEARLQRLEASLQALRDADRAEPGFVQQQDMINLYIKEAKTEISLARFLAKIGETRLDLGAISAAAQRLAALTGDFLAMIAGWAGRVSHWLPPLGERLRRGAAGLLKSVKLGWWVMGWRRERKAAPVEPDLAEVRRRLLAGEPIPQAWVPGIHSITLAGEQFSAIERLACLTELQSLDLRFLPIGDLVPLASLGNLRGLDLLKTQIRDIAPLAALVNLEVLYLSQTRISDISPVSGLRALRKLDLHGTQVSDISPLAALERLEWLDLWQTQVASIAPLAGLASLRDLDLRDTLVSDVAPLAALANLRSLDLVGTKVSDIAPLAVLAKLESLDLASTPIHDITPLVALHNLRHLWLSSPKVKGLAAVRRRAGLIVHFEGEGLVQRAQRSLQNPR